MNKPGTITTKRGVSVGALGGDHAACAVLTAAILKLQAKTKRARAIGPEDLQEQSRTGGMLMVEYESQKRLYIHAVFHSREDFVRSMIKGGASLDGGILVVNTHNPELAGMFTEVELARQLQVQNLVVFLDGCDAEGSIDECEKEVRQLLRRFRYDDDAVRVIRGAAKPALAGDARWERSIAELLDALDSDIRARMDAAEEPFRMNIDDVFAIKGRGPVVVGRIEQGVIRAGDEVEIVGFRETRKAVVVGVEMFRKLLDVGRPGDNVGCLLRGVEKDDVEPGQVLAKPATIQPYVRIECVIYVLTRAEGGREAPLPTNARLGLYARMPEVRATLSLPEGLRALQPGLHVTASVELEQPIALEEGLRFALRDGGRTVAAGVVTKILQ